LDVLAEGMWQAPGKSGGWVLAIEAKIDAEEGEAQLCKYERWLGAYVAQRKGSDILRVFLTPDGRPPESGDEGWEPLSFLELVRVFRKVYGELDPREPGLHFLRFYLAGVLQDVCGWPRKVTADVADPYAVVSYLKTLHDVAFEDNRHDLAR
jgi:hypothetical protein